MTHVIMRLLHTFNYVQVPFDCLWVVFKEADCSPLRSWAYIISPSLTGSCHEVVRMGNSALPLVFGLARYPQASPNHDAGCGSRGEGLHAQGRGVRCGIRPMGFDAAGMRARRHAALVLLPCPVGLEGFGEAAQAGLGRASR